MTALDDTPEYVLHTVTVEDFAAQQDTADDLRELAEWDAGTWVHPQDRPRVVVPPVAVPKALAVPRDESSPGQGNRGNLRQGNLSLREQKRRNGETRGSLVTEATPFDEEKLRRRWGADGDGRFPCPLPGHNGMAFLAYPDDDPDGALRLACCTGRWRSLGEVRMAEATGYEDFHPRNIAIATWTRLLAYETGTFEPLDVLVPALPPGASKDAHAARTGFRLLIGLRWADGEKRPVAFSVRFAAAWCSMGKRQAHEAITALLEHRVIHEAGRAGSYNRVRLYLPGDGR